MAEKEIEITVIVNGQPTQVVAHERDPLETIIPTALSQTGNTGQPPENWELRDASGEVLNVEKEIHTFHFPQGVRLFLNLKAGVGGELVVEQFADPEVSRSKFDAEIADFRDLSSEYRSRGWFLIEANFPIAEVLIGVPQINPSVVLTAVRFDFSNYDAQPPSVQLVNAYSGQAYRFNELPTLLNRSVPVPFQAAPGMPPGMAMQMKALQPLMQAHDPNDIPFLCVAGVREYHDHPGHSGDLWELHRASGAGRLVRILDIIHKYGAAPIREFQVNLVPQVGLAPGEAPE